MRVTRKWLTGGQFVLAVAALLLLGRLLSAEFLGAANIRNLLNQTSIIGVLALAQFLVVLIGGFDLSVAAILALGSVLVASLAAHHAAWVAVTAALAAGAGLGTLSGVAATLGRVPPLIATLGVASIARGLAFLVAPKSVPAPHALVTSLQFTAGVFTTTTVVWLLLSVLLAWVLGRTRLGRHLYAIGGNERSARLAGVAVVPVKVATYALAGTLSALAGVLFVIRSWSGMPHVGSGWELESIAGIVIGGTRLFGGEGYVLNAMLGMLIYQIVGNLMNLVSLDPYYQDIVKATVIVIVVGTSVLLGHRRGLRLWS
jgi:ribose/xylose/arabinose/galactoside ABC-type transport system permease subunit